MKIPFWTRLKLCYSLLTADVSNCEVKPGIDKGHPLFQEGYQAGLEDGKYELAADVWDNLTSQPFNIVPESEMITLDQLRKMHEIAEVMYVRPDTFAKFAIPFELRRSWFLFMVAKDKYQAVLSDFGFTVER